MSVSIRSIILASFGFFLLQATTFAIPIGPDKYYLEVQPGEEINETLTIYGKGDLDQEQKLYFSVVGMKKVGQENEREFYIPNPNDTAEPANWINLDFTEEVIYPGSTVILPWVLNTTSTPTCGTNLAAIMVSNTPPETYTNSTTITVKKEIISQIHITFPNNNGIEECKESVKTESFTVNKKIKIFNYDNVPFKTLLKNNGDYITRSPIGFIEIFGMGDKITVNFNEENLDIYPQTTRQFLDIWTDAEYPHNGNFFEKLGYELTHLRFGKYEARLGVTKNVSQDIIAYDSFWIIPWRILLILFTLIFGTNRLLTLKTRKSLETTKNTKS